MPSPRIADDFQTTGWRGYVWGALAVLTCPCHLPVLLLLLSGTTAGAVLSNRLGISALVLVAVFILSLSRALRYFRRRP